MSVILWIGLANIVVTLAFFAGYVFGEHAGRRAGYVAGLRAAAPLPGPVELARRQRKEVA